MDDEIDKRTELALKIYDFIENQLKEAIEDTSEYLIGQHSKKYDYHIDCDFVDGRCVRWDEDYNKDKLYEDAVEKVIDELETADGQYYIGENLCSNCDFIDLMKQIIKDIRNEN